MCVWGRQIKNTNTKNRMGWVTALSEMSHPPLRAVISPERDERWSLEQRSPLTPIHSLAPAKQHHIPQALSLSAALSFLTPLRRKQLRINLSLFKSLTACQYLVELHECDQTIPISDAWLLLMKADSIRQCSMCFCFVPEDKIHIFFNKWSISIKRKNSPSVGWLGSTEFYRWFLLQPGSNIKEFFDEENIMTSLLELSLLIIASIHDAFPTDDTPSSVQYK